MKDEPENFLSQEDKVSVLEKLSYSVGFAGKDCIQVVMNTYLFVFLLEVVGLNPAFVGTLLLVARVVDSFLDPVIGQIADHTNSKWGRFRPYFLFGSFPLAAVFCLIMFVPDFSVMSKMIWVFVLYIIWGVCFTIMEIPFFGMVPAMTASPHERALVTSWSRIASRIPSIGIPIIAASIVGQIGAKNGYFYLALGCSGIMILGAIIAFFGCKEKNVIKCEKAPSFNSFFSILKGNRALLVVILVQLFFTFNMILGNMLDMQYISHYLEKPNLSGIILAVASVAMILGQLIIPKVQKMAGGSKKTLFIGFTGYLICLIACGLTGKISITVWLVCMFVLNMFGGAMQITIINLCFDTADYVEWKTGQRADSTIFAIVSFVMKLSAGLAGTLAGFSLGLAGFDSTLSSQPESVITALNIVRFAVPGVLVAAAFICLIAYPLSTKQVSEIQRELWRIRDTRKENERQVQENEVDIL
jgi:sugar (glycoside-pentoside-hexuronide) transporter